VQAIERHANTTISPWSEGAKVDPAPVRERPRRHEKPHVARPGDEPQAKLIVSGGRAAGIEVADIVAAITRGAGLDGEAVRNVRVLERFAFVEVPASDAERVISTVGGTSVRGHQLQLAPANA
jgi:ATP-dependent RNA helicase DeaD